jgi:ferritin
MLSQKLQDALNDQINAEYYSSYLYLAMSAHCESINLTGFAHWMRLQSKEEMDHALKILGYLLERRADVELKAIDKPPKSWDSPVAIFEQTMKHEQMVTKRIDDLVNLAIADKDHATQAFLQWFVSEQVEEEARADSILQKVKAVGGSAGGLFMLDHHLGGRV